ncbi:hypothetical protein COV19_04715 [Candidatus Woesearchaeota archaeon CG10_big_fil_rev_8_21_14_0_10_44_13]|nr:MAG: hypothetical protein COV19_04715 [Candidatus Woesearchaeota archaeon CG10_big_fil_rev_8_21_14_0_10_44_13]
MADKDNNKNKGYSALGDDETMPEKDETLKRQLSDSLKNGVLKEEMGGTETPWEIGNSGASSQSRADSSAEEEETTQLPPLDPNRIDDLHLHLIPYIPQGPVPSKSLERLGNTLDQILMNDDPGQSRQWTDFGLSEGDILKVKSIVDSYNPEDVMRTLTDIIYQKSVQVLGPYGNEDQRMMQKDTLFSLMRRAKTKGFKADYNHQYSPEEKNEMRHRAFEAAVEIYACIPRDKTNRSTDNSLAKIGEILGVREEWYHHLKDEKHSQEDIEEFKKITIQPTLVDGVLESGEWRDILKDAEKYSGISSEEIISLITDVAHENLFNLGKKIFKNIKNAPGDKKVIADNISSFLELGVKYNGIIFSAAHYDAVSKIIDPLEHLGHVDGNVTQAVTAEQRFLALFEKLRGQLKEKLGVPEESLQSVDYGYFLNRGYKEYEKIIDHEDPNAREQNEKMLIATKMDPQEVLKYAAARKLVRINDYNEDLVNKYNLGAEKLPIVLFLPVGRNGTIRYHIFSDDSGLIATDNAKYHVELDNFNQHIIRDGKRLDLGKDNGVRGFEIDVTDSCTMVFTTQDYINGKKKALEKKVEVKAPEKVRIHLADLDDELLSFKKVWGFGSTIYGNKNLVSPAHLYRNSMTFEDFTRNGFELAVEDIKNSTYLGFPVLESLSPRGDGLGEEEYYPELLVVKVDPSRKNEIISPDKKIIIPVNSAAVFTNMDLKNGARKGIDMKAFPSKMIKDGKAYVTLGFEVYQTSGPSAWLTIGEERMPINFQPYGAAFATQSPMYAIKKYNLGDPVDNPRCHETAEGIDMLARGIPVAHKLDHERGQEKIIVAEER